VTGTDPHVFALRPGTWTCVLHKDHGTAVPIRGAVHHVFPRGAGGPDIPANKVTVCGNGHDAVHAVMWELAHGRPPLACSRTELALAKRGVTEWVADGGVIGRDVPMAFMG
jgi:hypothetical protein